MTHVDSQTVQCHLSRCLIAVVTDAPGNIRPERSHITHSVKLSWPALSGRLLGAATKWAKMRVCTMCTPWASDRVVHRSDWAGLRRFSGEWRKFKGWNPVRVPPRAQCFRRSEAFLVFLRVDSVHTLASDLMFRVYGVPDRRLFGCVGERLPTVDRVPPCGVPSGGSSSFWSSPNAWCNAVAA